MPTLIYLLGRRFEGGRLEWPWVGISGGAWTAEHLLAEIVRRYAGERALRVRYEDLMTSPRRELERIGAFLACDLSAVIEAVEAEIPLATGHSFGGNARRLRGPTVFDPRVGTGRPLARRHRVLTRALCWPMMLRHGYPLTRAAP